MEELRAHQKALYTGAQVLSVDLMLLIFYGYIEGKIVLDFTFWFILASAASFWILHAMYSGGLKETEYKIKQIQSEQNENQNR